jgi:hypothetical protein
MKNKSLNVEVYLEVEDGTARIPLLIKKISLVWALFGEEHKTLIETETAKRPLGFSYRNLDTFADVDFEKVMELGDSHITSIICNMSLYQRRCAFVCSLPENPASNTLIVEHLESVSSHQEAYRMLTLLKEKTN